VAHAAALVLTLALAWALGRVAPEDSAFRVTALAIGIALVAAALAGSLIERLRLPRVTGYLIFGLLCGPYVANIITRPMARELAILNGLAVTLIAFVAGLEINLRRLAPRMRSIATLSAVTMGVLYAVLFAALWTVWPWLAVAPALGGVQRIAAAALLTTLVASFSPTVTIAIVAESRAAGPLTELTLAVVILADLVLILVFTLVMQLVRFAFGSGGEQVGIVIGVVWEVFGSLAFGAIAGSLFAFYLRHVAREVPLVVIGFCAAVAGIATVLHLEPLMSALAAGLLVENLVPDAGDILKEAVEKSALPVLVVFFAAAGAALQLDALATIGWIAGVVALLRIALIRIGARLGCRAANLRDASSDSVWMGLVSQAGVTLGLTLIVAEEHPDWGAAIQTLMLALIALHQLIGPILFRAALLRAGEIGGADRASLPARGAANTVPA
jgi:Kef-type K+ transport system membrane component KefB